MECIHLGPQTGEFRKCESCRGTRVAVHLCSIHGECTTKKDTGIACCNGRRGMGGRHEPCPNFATEKEIEMSRPAKTWAVGVTTVPERKELLEETLESLKAAGFSDPHLFVDGCSESSWERDGGARVNRLRGEITLRSPKIRTFGNWMLGLAELYIRNPACDHYAMFQDDLQAVKNLRGYINHCEMPERGYWNLYTFPENELIAPRGGGWFEASEVKIVGQKYHGKMQQTGRGAVGLVFSREGVQVLLSSIHTVARPSHVNGWKRIDGGIVEAMNMAGWREWVHSPSLLQHVGHRSTMGAQPHPMSKTFPGEWFDAMDLLKERVEK